MLEGFEKRSPHFVTPNIEKERGEFDRVAKTFMLDVDTLMFLAKEEGVMVTLADDTWDNLENTDSNRFEKGDWKAVESHAHESERDWLDLKEKMEKSSIVDAPIIFEYKNVHHLVSGNTRLMVARALGISPQVLLFKYTHDRTNEERD